MRASVKLYQLETPHKSTGMNEARGGVVVVMYKRSQGLKYQTRWKNYKLKIHFGWRMKTRLCKIAQCWNLCGAMSSSVCPPTSKSNSGWKMSNVIIAPVFKKQGRSRPPELYHDNSSELSCMGKSILQSENKLNRDNLETCFEFPVVYESWWEWKWECGV